MLLYSEITHKVNRMQIEPRRRNSCTRLPFSSSYQDPDWIRPDSIRSVSGFGIQIRTHKNRKKVQRFNFLKCWLFSLRGKGFSWSLDVLYESLGISKLQFLIKKYQIFVICKFFPIFSLKTPGSGSGLIFRLKCWIRIRNQWIQIRNTTSNEPEWGQWFKICLLVIRASKQRCWLPWGWTSVRTPGDRWDSRRAGQAARDFWHVRPER